MAKLRSLWTAAVLLAALAATTIAQSVPATATDRGEEDRLIAVLKSSGSTEQQKRLACQRLQVVGSARAIPALAALLADERLSHAARQALEANADPGADSALRGALRRAKGSPLIGVIASVGRRRDTQAVEELTKLLRQDDAAVAAASALALGNIADDRSIAALREASSDAPATVKASLFDACLRAADARLRAGDAERAGQVFEWLMRHAETPKPVRTAAVRGVIVSRGHPEGTRLAVEQLTSNDASMFEVALRVLQEGQPPELASACAAELKALPPQRQVRLIEALAGRGDASAAGAVIAAAEASDAAVRLAAIRAMPQLGDPGAIPLLVRLASGEQGETATAAQAALVAFPGPDADTAVIAMLGDGNAAGRRAAVEIMARRRVADATRLLFKAATDKDEQTRIAAIRALGEVSSPDDSWAVIRALLEAKGGAEADAAERAVAAVIARAQPREAMAAPLIAALPDAGAAGRCALLRLLGSAGGAKALEAVRSASKAFDKQVQDAAIRALCEWRTADAAPDVLAIARSGENPVHKRLALRGYIRMISDGNLSPEQRAAMCADAASLAKTPEDRKLILGALGAVPTKETLAAAVAQLEDPAVMEEAAAAVLAIAEKLPAAESEAAVAALTRAAAATKDEAMTRRIGELSSRIRGNKP